MRKRIERYIIMACMACGVGVVAAFIYWLGYPELANIIAMAMMYAMGCWSGRTEERNKNLDTISEYIDNMLERAEKGENGET